MNCSLHESKLKLCPKVVLDWFPRFADRGCARLADSGLRPLAMCRTFDHGCVVCPSPSVFVPIGLHAVYSPAALCGWMYRERRVHSRSPAIPDGECGVM